VEAVPENCRLYDEDLSALLDGELSPARADELRRHCASCERCAAQLALLRAANERLLSALRTPAPVAEEARLARVEARLRARLAEEGLGGPQRRRSPTKSAPLRARPGRWLVAAAAGLAAAAALGLAVLFQARSPVPVPRPLPPIAQTPPLLAPGPESQPPPPAMSPQPPAVAELPSVKPAPARPRPPTPRAAQPEELTPPIPSGQPEIDLATADEEDIELASRLDMLEDFEVIQKLDLLERLQKAQEGAGSG